MINFITKWKNMLKIFSNITMLLHGCNSQLITLRKTVSMSIDQYLREAKQIVDSLVAISSPVPSLNLIDHVLLGLGKEYDTFCWDHYSLYRFLITLRSPN